MTFSAPVISGTGRGKEIGFPTLNLDTYAVPSEIEHGVYACFVRLGENGVRVPAILHVGPRPTFALGASCEVHVLHHIIDMPPRSLVVNMADKIRDVMKFKDAKELRKQIKKDCMVAESILCPTC